MNLRLNNCRLCIEDLEIGTKVTYLSYNKREFGIVKSKSDEEHVFVVYNCAGEWEKFDQYTAARTNISDLELGWNT